MRYKHPYPNSTGDNTMKCKICGEEDDNVIYISTVGKVHRECYYKKLNRESMLNLCVGILMFIFCFVVCILIAELTLR